MISFNVNSISVIILCLCWRKVSRNLFLQLLKRRDGWPVPKYLGSCGRLIIETSCGQSLLSAADLAWTERAAIALQLLDMADRFTDAHPDFRFYLTDVSPDNIAFDFELKVAFVDLENVIINSKDKGGMCE